MRSHFISRIQTETRKTKLLRGLADPMSGRSSCCALFSCRLSRGLSFPSQLQDKRTSFLPSPVPARFRNPTLTSYNEPATAITAAGLTAAGGRSHAGAAWFDGSTALLAPAVSGRRVLLPSSFSLQPEHVRHQYQHQQCLPSPRVCLRVSDGGGSWGCAVAGAAGGVGFAAGITVGSIRRFGGRAGGLKRHKRKRDPGRLHQTGRGRRLEFFWPRKSHLIRTPLLQNRRPSLVYDQRMRRFLCCWSSNHQQVFRAFSIRSRASGRDGGRSIQAAGAAFGMLQAGGFEAARAKALLLLQQLRKQRKLKDDYSSSSSTKPEINRSGVSGVYFDHEERLWVAVWQEAGFRRLAAFSVAAFGFDGAYKAAVNLRKQKLQENYQFCMHKYRRRSGRQPYK